MSTVSVWRIEKEMFAKTVKLGEGARRYGGRWNSPGRPAIYCAQSFSLGLVEVLAHVTTEEDAGVRRVYFRIEVPEDSMIEVPLARLPKNWRSPLNTRVSQNIGDKWLIAAGSVVLKVPSAIAPMEFNYLLNPLHPDFKKRIRWSKAKSFEMEPRLLQNI